MCGNKFTNRQTVDRLYRWSFHGSTQQYEQNGTHDTGKKVDVLSSVELTTVMLSAFRIVDEQSKSSVRSSYPACPSSSGSVKFIVHPNGFL
jgi:hypothetical protein